MMMMMFILISSCSQSIERTRRYGHADVVATNCLDALDLGYVAEFSHDDDGAFIVYVGKIRCGWIPSVRWRAHRKEVVSCGML